MTFRRLTPLATSLFIAVSLVSTAHADENVPLDKLPAAVRETIVKATAKGKLDEIEMKLLDGRVVFDAEYTIDGVDHCVVVDDAGKMIEEAVEVPMKSVPAAIIEAAKKKYPDATIDETEIVTAAGKKSYRISMDLGDGKERELDYDESAKLIADREDDD